MLAHSAAPSCFSSAACSIEAPRRAAVQCHGLGHGLDRICSSKVHQKPAARRPGRGTRIIPRAIDESGILDVVGNVLGRKFQPETAVLASAFFALLSVVVNIFGGLLTERKRADLVLELERNKQLQRQQAEVQSVIARYRGPLLESAIDLEQRLWHLATDQCFDQGEENRDEEIRYVMFTLAQFLGFVEVVRREGPRERPFLQSGSSQGTDTLATLVEGIRFILCSNPSYLEAWAADKPRTHPGARGRKDFRELLEIREENMQAAHRREHDLSRLDAFKISRGVQRAIGSLMITTPNGAEVHYTMSYAAFCDRMNNDPAFAEWFGAIRRDIAAVSNGDRWIGQKPFPFNRWTRVLLFQQQLVDTIDLLDPDCVRLPMERRVRLRPISYEPLPRVEEYHRQLRELSVAVSGSKGQSAKGDAAGEDSTQDLLVGLENLVRYSNKGMLERMESFSDGTYLVRRAAKTQEGATTPGQPVNGKKP